MSERTRREMLGESPLFANLLPSELSLLADLFTEREFAAGDPVFREGEVGDSLFVIVKGTVEVLRKKVDGSLVPIAQLGAPQFFGEMSLIDKEYRSATVRATGPTTLLQLSNENLYVFAKHYRNGFTWVVMNIARVLSARLRQTNKTLTEKL